MNLDLLIVGSKVKYATLCEAFGVEKKTGKQKQLQFKEFERHVKLEKDGTWFLIVEKYDIPLEKEDKRKDNGKSEASQKALEENRSHRPSFFKEDELQLAILWILGMKAYRESDNYRENRRYTRYIPCNELYVAVGLCNEYFTTLSRNKHYYCKTNKDDNREIVYDLWQVNMAFDGVYDKMKRYSITAFTQLQRKKIVEFSYWKMWNNGRKDSLFTDEQMNVFVEKRQDALELWCDTHNIFYGNVGDLYNNLTPKEAKEFEEQLLELLGEDELFKNIQYYCSCFKVFYSLRTIRRELVSRGFEIGKTKEDFEQAFLINMKDTVERVNNKFIELNEQRINKKRDEHIEKFECYEQEMVDYYAQFDGLIVEERRSMGRRTIKKPNKPNCDLADIDKYNGTKEILHLGLQHELDETLDGLMQGVEHCIEVNRKDN